MAASIWFRFLVEATMKEYFHSQVAEEIAQVRFVTLATYGPAGLQVGRYPVEADGVSLYILIPRTADLLHNIEGSQAGAPEAIAISETWQAHGWARLVETSQIPPHLSLRIHPQFPWSRLIAIEVHRFEKMHRQGWGFVESIDLTPEGSERENNH